MSQLREYEEVAPYCIRTCPLSMSCNHAQLKAKGKAIDYFTPSQKDSSECGNFVLRDNLRSYGLIPQAPSLRRGKGFNPMTRHHIRDGVDINRE